ncbi:MAG TPA: DUF1566 domain-containing protein [Vicinamibacterales bacterium]
MNLNGDLASSDALLLLRVAVGQDVPLECLSPGTPLRTHQTSCYNAAGTVIACPGTGQDGELRFGVERSFTDNGDGTITDNVTGLMWEKLSNDGSIHDKDNEYIWTNAIKKAAQLSAASFAGHDDWRLPNRFELETLVNLAAPDPRTFAPFHIGCQAACTNLTCSCTPSTNLWTSTTTHSGPAQAWTVLFDVGFTDYENKISQTHPARVVRTAF